MQVKICLCSHIDHSLKHYEIDRTFVVNDPQLESLQVCYFERYIPELQDLCTTLLAKFKTTSSNCLFIEVVCHGYLHKYDFKNGKIIVVK